MYCINIPLTFPEGEQLHPSMGSVFHGALMELVGDEQARRFHEQQLRPYRQTVFTTAYGQTVWQFGILTDDAYGAIMAGLKGVHTLHLRNRGYAVTLGEMELVRHEGYLPLMAKYLSGPVPKDGTFQFRTTTSFKQQGQYVVFPDTRLIFQSLLMRFNSFSPEPLEDGIVDVLSYYARPRQFDVYSQSFGVEHRAMYGFVGKLTYGFYGEDMVRRTLALLVDYANFSGIGIKTALGMGAVRATVRR